MIKGRVSEMYKVHYYEKYWGKPPLTESVRNWGETGEIGPWVPSDDEPDCVLAILPESA